VQAYVRPTWLREGDFNIAINGRAHLIREVLIITRKGPIENHLIEPPDHHQMKPLYYHFMAPQH
jgi:hypothetical protein